MKNERLQKQRQLNKQRPPKLVYSPAKQFKHRDRGTQAGRTNIR